MWNIYFVAWKKQLTVGQVENMSLEEFYGWLAFFTIQKKQEEKNQPKESKRGKTHTF